MRKMEWSQITAQFTDYIIMNICITVFTEILAFLMQNQVEKYKQLSDSDPMWSPRFRWTSVCCWVADLPFQLSIYTCRFKNWQAKLDFKEYHEWHKWPRVSAETSSHFWSIAS